METNDIVRIYPTENGYRFSPEPGKYKAALLAILERTLEIKIDDIFSVFAQAAWLEPIWTAPKRPAGFVAGLKATRLRSAIHRGSQSMWAIAYISERSMSFAPAAASQAVLDLQTLLPVCLKEQGEFADSFRAATQLSSHGPVDSLLEAIPSAMTKIDSRATTSSLTNPLMKLF